ncbi:MAG TPA: hypothetical protein VJA16_13160, partial [Thermoanaerobaculia bacterium]
MPVLPSPGSPQRLAGAPERTARCRRALLAAAALLGLAAAACVESRPPARPPAPPESVAAATIRRERAYLLSPLEGYAAAVDPARR